MKLMSRFGLVLTMAMLLSSVAFGQLGIKKGVKGGINVATLRLDNDEGLNISSRTGFAGGVFLEIDPPVFPLSLEVDALFSQKGAEFKSDFGTGKVKLNYVDIPVLAKFSIPIAPTASYHVVAGPSISFKIGESFDPDIEDTEDQFESADFGLVFGLGVEMNALISSVAIDVRYALGLSDISKPEMVDGQELTNATKNGVIQVLVGIGF